MRSCHHRRMATDPPFRSPCVLRRDVLIGGAVGAAVVLAPRLRARGAVPADLDRGIRELMAAGRLPGLSAAVVRGGEVVWSHAWGMANIAAGRRVTPDTLFMLASVSKTVVATAVLQAIEDGLFELDTLANDVLPFPVRHPVHPDRPITVRQLLTHTSSIRDNWNLLTASYVAEDSAMELRTFLRRYLSPGGADFAPNNIYAFGPGRSYRLRERGRRRGGVPGGGGGRDRLRHLVRAADLRASGHGSGGVAPRRTSPSRDRDAVHVGRERERVRPDGALRLPRLPGRRAQDDRPAARPASRDGDGWRLLARSSAAVEGLGPGASARSGARRRAGAGLDLVPSPVGPTALRLRRWGIPASRPSASSTLARTWAWSRSRTAGGGRPAVTTRCT